MTKRLAPDKGKRRPAMLLALKIFQCLSLFRCLNAIGQRQFLVDIHPGRWLPKFLKVLMINLQRVRLIVSIYPVMTICQTYHLPTLNTIDEIMTQSNSDCDQSCIKFCHPSNSISSSSYCTFGQSIFFYNHTLQNEVWICSTSREAAASRLVRKVHFNGYSHIISWNFKFGVFFNDIG